MIDYLLTYARRSERNYIFFEKEFDRERFLKKNPHIFLFAIKEKMYHKKLKVATTKYTDIHFQFKIRKYLLTTHSFVKLF